jgi:hypothetical protein
LLALAWASAPAGGQSEPDYKLSDAATDRLADDLALSEAQRTMLLERVAAYQAMCRDELEKHNAKRRDWTRQFFISIMPELDESVDISHLSYEEQIPIEQGRQSLKRGGIPGGFMNGEQVEELNAKTRQLSTELQEIEQGVREEVLNGLREVLAPEQVERWPVAMRRLDINIDDQDPRNRYSADDPRRRVDMLAMIAAAAAEEEGELHDFAGALLAPDRVLEHERNDQDRIDIAELVLGFEVSYRDALESFRREKHEHLYEQVSLVNRGDKESAARLERKMVDAERRIWSVRQRFAEDMAHAAREKIGDEASRAWQRRCEVQFCPVLYLEESTDMLYKRIAAMEGLDPAIREMIEEVYRQHDAWREEFKPRVVKLEIEERCAKLWADPRDERGATERLENAHRERLDRARQVNERMRALLPAEHQSSFDEWLKAWRDDTGRVPYPFPVYVRP